jgi:hypothetical protein
LLQTANHACHPEQSEGPVNLTAAMPIKAT